MFYKLLEHLPKIPQHFIIDNLNRKEIIACQQNQEVNHEKKIFPRVAVTDDLAQWIIENITTESTSMDIAVTTIKSKSVRMFPHTDSKRMWTLMYLVKNGGDEHRTVFYKHRDPTFEIKQQMNFTDDEIIEVDSIKVPLKTWAIINAHEIHSVENIPGVRIAIQLGMNCNPWE